ncbi:MAG: RnfABCDGE type electron transport complex subunit G [Clostridia bacterium]|nr:RnfABCDGE type electron transport complex subunit G [Clostridia bacterium]
MKKQTKPTAAKKENALDYGEIVKVAAILAAICLVITALLAATNELTVDRIAENSAADKAAAYSQVISAPQYVEQDGGEDYELTLAVSGSDVIGCAITTTDKGYGGEIAVMTGFDMNGNITGVYIIEHNETPGLGANAAKDKFLGQFVTPGGEYRPIAFAVSKDGGEIDSVTAATISSRAVTRAVNKACVIFDELSANGKLTIAEDTGITESSSDVTASDVSAADVSQNTTDGGDSNE